MRIIGHDYAGNADTSESGLFAIVDCGSVEADSVELSSDDQVTKLFLAYQSQQDHAVSFDIWHWDNAWDSIGHVDTVGIGGSNVFEWELPSVLQHHYDSFKVSGVCEKQCGPGSLIDSFAVERRLTNDAPQIVAAPFLESNRSCVEYGSEPYVVTLLAWDNEDRDALTYQWTTNRGHFEGGGTSRVTSCPEVDFYPPVIEEDCVTKSPMLPPDISIYVTVRDRALKPTTVRRPLSVECPGECTPQPECDCGLHGDNLPVGPNGFGDGCYTVLDVTGVVSAAFRQGCTPHWNMGCPYSSGDLNADGAIIVLDVVEIVNLAFRNQLKLSTEPCGQQ